MKNRPDKILPVGKSKAPYSQAVKIKTETSAGVLKTITLALILILQLVGAIYLSYYFVNLATWALITTLVLSAITCVSVLSSNKNSQSKAVWIIVIFACFSFGYVLYILSDERIFFRKSKKRFDAIMSRSEGFICQKDVKIQNVQVKRDADFLLRTGNFPAYNNCSLEYFSSANEMFDDLIERIKSAKKFIFIEFFIVSDGNLFNRILDVLKERVKDGVDVRLIYDDMGSHKTLSIKSKLMLKNAGIKVCPFNRLIPIFSLALNIRDHRKIVVIDGKYAYAGGCNLADEYVNEKRMYGYWKDSALRLEGEAVDSFTIIFLRQWEFLKKKVEDYSQFLGHYEKIQNSSTVIPYADGLEYKEHVAKGVYENMICSANETITIMTPYFIIDDAITELLINKALSGVQITLFIPEVPDKKYAYGITRSNAEKLIDYGVKLLVVKNAFVHSKIVLTDNAVVVGSINMDFRSFYQQFECAVYTDDVKFIEQVKNDLNYTASISRRVTQRTKFRRSLLYRIYAGLMQLFAPFM